MTTTPRESEWQRRKRRERERFEHIVRHGDYCELCGAGPREKGLCGATRKVSLHEDHDHATGAHRGWICGRANKQLWGWVTPAWLRAAADYLEARA